MLKVKTPLNPILCARYKQTYSFCFLIVFPTHTRHRCVLVSTAETWWLASLAAGCHGTACLGTRSTWPVGRRAMACPGKFKSRNLPTGECRQVANLFMRTVSVVSYNHMLHMGGRNRFIVGWLYQLKSVFELLQDESCGRWIISHK